MKSKVLVLIFILAIFTASCGRKADPTMEDYIAPSSVENVTATFADNTITIQWSYPEKQKSSIAGFNIEKKTSEGEFINFQFVTPDVSFIQDKDFQFDKTYTYRITAANKKGIYSKPALLTITPLKLRKPENLTYFVTDEGVMLKWSYSDSLSYNIYRFDKDKLLKRGGSENKFFIDDIRNLPDDIKELHYFIRAFMSKDNLYIEGDAEEIKIPLEKFIPEKVNSVVCSVTENGVYISWKENKERWIKGYRVYRKTALSEDFTLIAETKIPFFFDGEYKKGDHLSISYKITAVGPAVEGPAEEIFLEIE